MSAYLSIAQILVSLLLIAVIILQLRGGGLGGLFGQPGSVYRTKRGLERTLFRFTIALAILFILIAILSVRAHSW